MTSTSWAPKPHQEKGIKFLISRGSAALMFKPGLGKTSTTLAAFKVLREQKFARRMFLMAPLMVAQHVWTSEVQKWADFNDLRCSLMWGPGKLKAMEAEADIFLLNYDALPWFAENNGFETIDAQVMVADELTRLKNGKGKRFKALKPHLNRFKYRWGLTGTPVPNGLLDLWGQMYVLDSGAALGRFVSHYRNQYFVPTGYGGYTWELQAGAEELIYERIKPYALFLNADDYVKMPKLQVNDIFIELPPNARSLYDSLYDDFIAEVGETTFVAANTAAAGVKCRQVCNGALYDENKDWIEVHDAKLEALENLLEEINHEPCMILYEFQHDAIRIQKLLGDRCKRIGSGVGKSETAAIIKQFNQGELEILLAHPGTAGHGLNLQEAARHVVYFGLTWDLELYEQAIARILRQGNPHDVVMVHRILANRTLDKRVAKVIGSKDVTQRRFLKAMLTEKD